MLWKIAAQKLLASTKALAGGANGIHPHPLYAGFDDIQVLTINAFSPSEPRHACRSFSVPRRDLEASPDSAPKTLSSENTLLLCLRCSLKTRRVSFCRASESQDPDALILGTLDSTYQAFLEETIHLGQTRAHQEYQRWLKFVNFTLLLFLVTGNARRATRLAQARH